MTFRLLAAAMTALALCLGCQEDPHPKPAANVTVRPATPAIDKEVLVASQPSDAEVFLKGAKVGTTPMKLLVRGDTNLILEKEGYVKQALLITPKSNPNLVVELVPSGDESEAQAPEEVAPEEAGEDAREEEQKKADERRGSGKKGKKSGKEGAGDEANDDGAAETGTAAAPELETEPEKEAAPAKPKKKTYTTMRQLKEDLSKGIITRQEFRKWQGEIRKKRSVDLQAAEKAYRAGEMTRDEYRKKVREIKLKYEG